ncbi:hypothetical protein KR222_001986, partial [Zaprionus bogoriensis]
QFSQHYKRYLAQFVPYYFNLATAPLSNSCQPPTSTDMDIEKYINQELSKQQTQMRRQNGQALTQLQVPSAPPAALPAAPLPVARHAFRVAPGAETVDAPRYILNVQVMAVEPREPARKPKDVVEPLPPVQDSLKEKVAKIQRSQSNYNELMSRLTSMMQTLNRRYDGTEPEPEKVPVVKPAAAKAASPPLKRPRQMSSSSSESQPDSSPGGAAAAAAGTSSAADEVNSQYPRRVEQDDGNVVYVLGPNGTEISAKQYAEIFWTNAPVATRCLLAVVFTSDELATHTLTGKPSPAFYGRERPPKKMLNQGRVDDIIVSVRNRTGGKERHIRATITTKCADTAKKYKRRAKKLMDVA